MRGAITRVADLKPRLFLPGARLVWRQQRALWLIYAVNLILGVFATRETVVRSGEILNHSAAAERLARGSDIGTYFELMLHPSMPFAGARQTMIYSGIVFTIFMVFATGGVLTAFYEDRPFHVGVFFAACGENFTRLFRLMVYFIIVLLPVLILATLASTAFGRLERSSISPFPPFYFLGGVLLVLALILTSLRLWFDLAELLAVAEGEESMRRVVRRGLGLLHGNFLTLFWAYVRIAVVGWIGFLFGLYLWMYHLRPEWTAAAFILSQLMILFSLAVRLWQRAAGAVWLRQYEPQMNVAMPSPTAPPTAHDQPHIEPSVS
jgi:hypothetical protein